MNNVSIKDDATLPANLPAVELPPRVVVFVPPQNSIELIDVLAATWRRRWLLLLGFVIAFVLGGAYLWFASPVFQSQALLRIGVVGGVPIELPDAVAVRLTEKYKKAQRGRGEPYLDRAEVRSGLLLLSGAANEPATAHAFVRDLVSEVLVAHEDVFARERGEIQQRLDEVGRQIELTANAASPAGDGAPQTFLAELFRERRELQAMLSSLKTQPTSVLREPEVPAHRSQPKPILVLAATIALGLALGLILVVCSELKPAMKERCSSTARR